MQQGTWFVLDNLYGRYYAAARVGRVRSDADTDANADEEGEARKGRDVGEKEELIGRGGDYTVYASGGCGRGWW